MSDKCRVSAALTEDDKFGLRAGKREAEKEYPPARPPKSPSERRTATPWGLDFRGRGAPIMTAVRNACYLSSNRKEAMASVTFDTLKFGKRLEAAGVSAQQGEARTQAFAEATSQELATKADLALLEARLTARIEAVEFEARGRGEPSRPQAGLSHGCDSRRHRGVQ